MKTIRTLGMIAGATLAGAILCMSATASAITDTGTRTVAWATTNDPTGPLPTDAGSVNWPQSLLSADGVLPECLPVATVVQVDQYRNVSDADKATIQALIESGVLQAPPGAGSDASVVTSWRFVVVPQCVTATPTPTPTSTAPTSPAPSSSAPSCVNPPHGNVHCGSPLPPSINPCMSATSPVCHPSTSAAPSSTPSVKPSVKPVAKSVQSLIPPVRVQRAELVAQPSQRALANTGATWKPYVTAGVLLVLVGSGLLIGSRRRA